MVNILKQVTLQRKRVLRDLLPDRCTVYPVSGTMTIDAGGVPSFSPASAREWVHPFNGGSGVTSIPCRIDPNKSQAPEKLKNQVVIVDQYYIELPFNFELAPTDIVMIVDSFNVEHRYRVAKLDLQGNLSLTTVAIIQELSVQVDKTP